MSLAALDASTITITGTSSTGDLTLTAGNIVEATDPSTVDIADFTVNFRSGDDTLSIAAADATDEMAIDLGAGDDTPQWSTVSNYHFGW